jgi:transposase InsO family protein/transposase-like protein
MAGKRRRRAPKKYDADFRVRVVETALAKKMSLEEVDEAFGVNTSTYSTWKKIFKNKGEEALRQYGESRRKTKKKAPLVPKEKVRKHIMAVKKEYPFFGVFRVWKWILRTLFLPVTYRQVREEMSEANLIQKKKRKKRKPPQPRRFERARPNQMWQTDITPLHLADGLVVQFIGFLDDHSRYIVSWGVYATATSELVLEVLRRGIAAYGKPPEVLTDNGPQYWTWRGYTVFQKFLRREDIQHIRSRRKHPQTLGKIEKLWSTLKTEFLGKAKRKGNLEEVRERLDHWVKWYNFQRFHTELRCTPAERFFQYEETMKDEIEKRIRVNEQELALSAQPPSGVIGEVPLGNDRIQVSREDEKFVVRLGEQELNQVEPNRKENENEKEETAAGADGSAGRAGQGQGVGGVGSPGRGEVDLAGVQGNGPQAAPVLQDRGQDGGGDARGCEDAAAAGKAEGSPRGGNDAGGADGIAPAGAPADEKPGEDLQEAVSQRGPETPEIRPQEAEIGTGARAGGGAGGDAEASGPSAQGGETPGVKPESEG